MTRTPDPAVVLGSSGPSFITAQGADEAYRPPRLLGFRSLIDQQLVADVARLREEVGPVGLDLPETEPPLLWEGDQA